MKPSLGGKSPGFASKVEIGLPNKKTKWNVEIEWKHGTIITRVESKCSTFFCQCNASNCTPFKDLEKTC